MKSLLMIFDETVWALSRCATQLRHELASAPPDDDLPDAPAGLLELVRALQTENEQLREALAKRAVIEQAKGMVMLLGQCQPEEAFSLLCDLSRRRRRKVRDLATELVTSRGRSLAGTFRPPDATVVSLRPEPA